MKCTFRPSIFRHACVHGFRAYMATKSDRQALLRRCAKDRKRLTV